MGCLVTGCLNEILNLSYILCDFSQIPERNYLKTFFENGITLYILKTSIERIVKLKLLMTFSILSNRKLKN